MDQQITENLSLRPIIGETEGRAGLFLILFDGEPLALLRTTFSYGASQRRNDVFSLELNETAWAWERLDALRDLLIGEERAAFEAAGELGSAIARTDDQDALATIYAELACIRDRCERLRREIAAVNRLQAGETEAKQAEPVADAA